MPGDPAKPKPGWAPKVIFDEFDEFVAEMVREGLKSGQQYDLVKKHGHQTSDSHE